jgi:hypothetical protein
MKRILSIFSIAAVMAACNSDQDKIMAESAKLKSYQDSVRLAADTAGLAEYQAFKMQNELNNTVDPYAATAGVAAASAPVARTYAPARSTSRGTSTVRRSSGSSGGGNSTASTGTTARRAKVSKAAKGAIVGGVVGAGAGAVINKKNRGVGAVIGGVLGAGAGYGIGRGMDKRDGRY